MVTIAAWSVPAPPAGSAAVACLSLAAALVVVSRGPAHARLGALGPPAGRPLRRPAAAVAPGLLGALAGLSLLGLGGALVGALAATAARRRRGRRRADDVAARMAGQLADALRRIVDELRAGQQPVVALGGIRADGALAADVLGPAVTAAELGDGVPSALRRIAVERADIGPELERIARAWSVAERHGIPLADLLARTQQDIRWRVRFAAAVRAQLAGPRATAAVLTALPGLGLGLGQLLGADPLGVLRGSLLGQALLVLGAGLAAVGLAWSERIVRAAVPT
jgi:tight adherence protein B